MIMRTPSTRIGILAILAMTAPLHAAATIYVDAGLDRSDWESAISTTITTETFDSDIAQSDTLLFSGGIQSVAADPSGSPNHLVTAGRLSATLNTATSAASGYQTITLSFPSPVNAFGADFFSIASSREVSVRGDFGSGIETFDLRALFNGDGGVDQGFFGLTSPVPFSSVTLVATGSVASNDSITVDNLSIVAVPEPSTFAALLFGGLLITGRRRR